MRKKECSEFDVAMGSYDGAEVAELVGLYLLYRMEDIQAKEFNGLYRDDNLLVVEGGGQEAERVKKKLFAMYKSEGLKITAEANLKTIQFLDVTFNLTDGSFKPFIKPNAQLRYVSQESNHPPLVLKNIPDGVNQRLERISSCKERFEEEKTVFQPIPPQAGIQAHQPMQVSDRKNIQEGSGEHQLQGEGIHYGLPVEVN